MNEDNERHLSEWRPISELRQIDNDISSLGYNKEFIDSHHLSGKKFTHASNLIAGATNYFEPIEVKEKAGTVFWRENENCTRISKPESFMTQFGKFNNHNNGEFFSWLGRDDYKGLPEREKQIRHLLGRDDFYIEGNYCDMFDCGAYSYAVSNLMHMGLGRFKIVRIDESLHYDILYDNSSMKKELSCLKYFGRFRNEKGYVLITSGFIRLDREPPENPIYQEKTILFQADPDGVLSKYREWGIEISPSNSIAVVRNQIYFGQNKMVTQVDLSSGEMKYYTNKNDEELAALTTTL